MDFKLVAAAFILAATPAFAETGQMEEASNAAAEIIDMRSSLAKAFIEPGMEITPETFKNICGRVGARVKELSETGGMKIRHATEKYRNPANKAASEEAALIKRFADEKDLNEVRDELIIDGKSYFRATRPIFVEEACLACHGDRDARPAFIKEKYPDDKAFGYRPGDLRGVISVMAPENPEGEKR
ncbi:MAG: DUF3365 domain-containing protein [Candidatus Methylomirabilis sp.]|nr:DUF3365 domain-containing protein [Deltaproteobacteria bacterium]